MYFTLQLLIIHPFLFPSNCHLQGMVVTILSTHRSIQDMEHHLQGIILTWIKWMKNYNEHTGYQTRNLSACSAGPQPTVPPRSPHDWAVSK
jgi:hypothetical protein